MGSEAPWPPARAPILFILSGPSGVGKDAVLTELRARGLDLYFPITATTRAPRPSEVDGRDYFFVSEAEFEAMRAEGKLLESAIVYNHWYGVPRDQVEQALARGRDVIVKVDVQGAETLQAAVPGAVSIFLAPGSLGELAERIAADARRSDAPADRARRLATARAEMDRLPNFDYVVLNRQGDLVNAVAQVQAIVTAERCRVARLAI